MDAQKVMLAGFFMFVAGAAYLFSQYQGIGGFVIGEQGGGTLNMGILLIILSFIFFVVGLRLRNPASSEEHTKEVKKQILMKNAREAFIDFYAREPTQVELEHFIERMRAEGKIVGLG